MPPSDDAARDTMSIVRGLLRIGSELHWNGDRIAGEYGLNQQQFVVLSEIVDRGPINQKQLIGGLVVEKSNLSKIAKKLKTLGLVEISVSPEDRRATLLRATEKGEAVWRECMGKFNMWGRRWLGPLTHDEMAEISRMLERLKSLPLQGGN